jgi:HSP20 family molecular chaperone IbpA
VTTVTAVNRPQAFQELAMNTLTQTPETDRTTQTPRAEAALLPPVDVIEDAGGITLHADLPGVPREALHLRVDGDQLSIEADVTVAAPQGLEVTHAEVALPRYRRTFTLSKELDPTRIGAELVQGVLRVRIPKAEHAQPRRITVQVQ